MKKLLIFLFIWMPIPAMGGWFGPSNYEECILKNMKGVTSDKAVLEIRKACRAKFPKKPIKKPKLRDVPKKVLEDITGDAWFEDRAHTDAPFIYNFYASLHNDNAKWTITEVKIRITDKATGTYEDVLSHTPFETINPYNPYKLPNFVDITKERENLLPFETEFFPFFAQKLPVKWEWNIIGAKGYSKP